MLRRLLVVLLALIVGVSVSVVSVVVAGSSAGAANTASEALFDHDDDAATPLVRQFAGADRYETSVALAEQYIEIVSSRGTVIVASGDSLVDAAAAAGLAASQEAPVLLTPTENLSSTVANFINEELVTDVYIVGGTSSVSQKVEDAIGALPSVRNVNRLAGDDRYATSVLVAEETGLRDTYCGANLATVVLVNVDSSFADVIAVGPLAYVLNLPILLTSANELPSSVASYLDDEDVEQVIVVGGTAAVSNAVVEQVRNAGVDDFVRVSGANRYATALAVRQLLVDCSTVQVSAAEIALINGEAAADGVAAGPVLGAGLNGGGDVVPVLLVASDSLPSDTSGFLAGTSVRNTDGTYASLNLTAIGGTAVVTDEVMTAAIAAASTSRLLAATIAAAAGDRFATITFSEQVDIATLQNSANYRVSGSNLFEGDSVSATPPDSATAVNPLVAYIYLQDALQPGSEIEIIGGKIKARAATDARTLPAVTFTVPAAAAPDRTRPQVRIVAPDNGHELRIEVIDQNLATSPSAFDFTKVRINDEVLPQTTTTQGGVWNRGNPNSTPGLTLATINASSTGTWRSYVEATGVGVRNNPDIPVVTDWTAQVRGTSTPNSIVLCLFGLVEPNNPFSRCRTAHLPPQTNNPPIVPNPTLEISFTGCTAGCPVTMTQAFPRTFRVFTDTATRLKTGDTITIDAGAFVDASGNASSAVTTTVGVNRSVSAVGNTAAQQVVRATVTSPAVYDANGPGPGGEALSTWSWQRFVYTGTVAVPTTEYVTQLNYLTITAKADGIAAGAAGNGWSVGWSELDTDIYDGDKLAEVQVSVLERRKLIQIKFDGDAKLRHVIEGLLSNSVVSENFTVSSDGLESAYSVSPAHLPLYINADPYLSGTAGTPIAISDILDADLSLLADSAAAEGTQTPPAVTLGSEPTTGDVVTRGAPKATNSPLTGGESTVTVSLIYNSILETFRYWTAGTNYDGDTPDTSNTLAGANQGAANYPACPSTAAWGSPGCAGWSIPSHDAEFSFVTRDAEGAIVTSVGTFHLVSTDETERVYYILRPTLTSVITFELHSANLAELPKSNDTINLPSGVAESYSASPGTSEAVAAQILRAG